MVLPFRSVPRIAAARLRALKALFWRHHQDLFLYTARPFLYVAGSLASYKLISEYLIALEGSSGPSMFPTLRVDGDFLLISRFQRYGRGVRIGDLVVYAQPQFSHFGAAKRIVGMPGDYVVVDPLVEPEQMQMTQVWEAPCPLMEWEVVGGSFVFFFGLVLTLERLFLSF
jgi:hypothetical protein